MNYDQSVVPTAGMPHALKPALFHGKSPVATCWCP